MLVIDWTRVFPSLQGNGHDPQGLASDWWESATDQGGWLAIGGGWQWWWKALPHSRRMTFFLNNNYIERKGQSSCRRKVYNRDNTYRRLQSKIIPEKWLSIWKTQVVSQIFKLNFCCSSRNIFQYLMLTKHKKMLKTYFPAVYFLRKYRAFGRLITVYRADKMERTATLLTVEPNCIRCFGLMHCCLYSWNACLLVPTEISN